MIDIKHKRCCNILCNDLAYYGPPNTKELLACLLHSENTDYVDNFHSKDARCAHPAGCSVINAVFYVVGDPNSRRCVNHQLKNSISLNKTDKCQIEKCNSPPTYGPIGSMNKTHCIKHAKDFINLLEEIRIPCRFKGCSSRPILSNPGDKYFKRCLTHVEEGMVYGINLKCKHKTGTRTTCGEPATYATDNMADRCDTHKNNGKQITFNKCTTCNKLDILNINNKCSTCPN
jgi:hypothetical protein